MEKQPETIPLTYTIAGCSEHSGRYNPENIMVDNPQDQNSRWSGAYQAFNSKQWVLLRLDQLCLLKTIKFGKHYRPHPCNMREFKLFVGETEDNMTQVLHAVLKNDSVPETFSLRTTNQAGIQFPTRFIKIVPLSAHGQPSFHISIWFIELTGIAEESFVEGIHSTHQQHQEITVFRHILKHLRQRRLLTAYHNILTQANLSQCFEHPLITSLHNSFVLNGSFSEAESVLSSVASKGLFASSIFSSPPYSLWNRIENRLDMDGDPLPAPSARGGHAMCYDRRQGRIYLFGGWDGRKDLNDFWVFDIAEGFWKLIPPRTNPGGDVTPSPRACHKMVFDETTGDIFLLGRFDESASGEPPNEASPHPTVMSINIDPNSPQSASPTAAYNSPSNANRQPAVVGANHSRAPVAASTSRRLLSEFYRYHTRGPDSGKWELISPDTASQGGPPLIFDHQMAIDCEAQVIYISGGREGNDEWINAECSGLYSYDIRGNTWKVFQSSDPSTNHPCIPSRYGHSMVLDVASQTLVIFAGQRDGKYLSDMYAFHIPTHTVTELFANFTTSGGPDACFTQRAVLDPELKEIYIFCGLTKGPPGALTVLESKSPYWMYRYETPDQPGKWTRILSPPTVPPTHFPTKQSNPPELPLPRYAHQVVYDLETKTLYMHGGNAGLDKDEVSEVEIVEVVPGISPPFGDRGARTAPGRGGDARVGNQDEAVWDGGEREEGHGSRLDDFWSMRLQRPVPESIVRRGSFLIRQQQFREMCEDSEPVRALTFLQTQVSAVVDHTNPEETNVFRSLLTHLLVPATRSTPKASLPYPARTGDSSVTPARKRSRPDTPTESEEQDEVMADETTGKKADTLLEMEGLTLFKPDLIEYKHSPDKVKVSEARFRQRTEVFEELMKFVNEDVKQPERDLFSLINIDQEET